MFDATGSMVSDFLESGSVSGQSEHPIQHFAEFNFFLPGQGFSGGSFWESLLGWPQRPPG